MSKILYPQTFKIVGGSNVRPKISGRTTYYRIFIEPTIKMEDRDYEVVDEETDTIYVVPEWMIPTIIEKIEYEKMTADWVNTIDFTYPQEENLRALEIMLFFSGDSDIRQLIEGQRLNKKQPQSYTYEQLLNMAIPKITEDAYNKALRKFKFLSSLRKEPLPTILNEPTILQNFANTIIK